MVLAGLDQLGREFKTQTHHNNFVFVKKLLQIPANNTILLFVDVNDCTKNSKNCDKHFIPMNLEMNEKNILIASAIVSVNSKKSIPIKIFNANDYAITIEKGTVLGYLEDFVPDENNKIAELEIEKGKEELSIEKLIEYHLSKHERSDCSKKNLEVILRKYFSVFSVNKMDLGKTDIFTHKIDTGDTKPIACLPRRIPQAFESKVDELVDSLLMNGIIEESSSPWNSPIVVVKKKSGDIRMCIDFRKINQHTKRPIYLIPDSKQIFDCLAK